MNVGSEASMQAIPCDLSSTISTGSFLTTETLDVSPVDTGKCFIVLVNGKTDVFFILQQNGSYSLDINSSGKIQCGTLLKNLKYMLQSVTGMHVL